MKHNRLWVVSVITAAAVLGLLVGCGGGGGGPSQDFIVGTWEVYALSDSFSGPKIPIEQFGTSYTMIFYADGTWVDFWSYPGSPPGSSVGTWGKVGEDYVQYEPGEDDCMVHRKGSQVYEVDWIEGIGLVWAWYHKT